MKLGHTHCPPLPAAALLPATANRPGQGVPPPPGAPAQTQKSLQEIWDRIGILETQKTALQNTADSQQQQITSLQRDSTAVSPLLDNTGTVLPRTLTTANSMRTVVAHTPLACTPGGQPSISYCDATSGDLKTTIRKPFVSP